MRKKFRRSVSSAASWSPRLGGWAIWLILIIIAGHRFQIISANGFFIGLSLGLGLALGGLGLAIKGFADLWMRGDKGGRASIKGVITSWIILAPLMLVGALWLMLPPFYDISSDLENPPPHLAFSRPSDALPLLDDLSSQADLQQISWPNLSGRRYEISSDSIITAIKVIWEENGWEGQEQINNINDAETLLTGVVRVPILGFAGDMVIRVRNEDEATLVDMRITSRDLPHDFGFGAYSIINFMQALDREVLLSAMTQIAED